MRKLVLTLGLLVAAGAVAGWIVTAPSASAEEDWAAAGPGDPVHGEQVFWTGGCASCHAAPGSEGDARLVLSGGLAIKSDFGTFHVPNISPDAKAGIGGWSLAAFGNAMLHGVDEEGEHLYPAFPYSSYSRMEKKDVADLYAYLKTLPPSAEPSKPHELSFPFNIRRGIGLWKQLYLTDAPRVAIDTTDPMVARGQYIVEGPGHCGECHTPRNALGGFQANAWLSGARNPDGKGAIPNITAGEGGIGNWSAQDIAYYLESGFTPDFDSVGGSMVEVQRNIARLPASDREAIAAYLKAVQPRPSGYTSGEGEAEAATN